MRSQRDLLFEAMVAGEIDLILADNDVAIGPLNEQARLNIQRMWRNRVQSEQQIKSDLRRDGYLGKTFFEEVERRMRLHDCSLILNRPFEDSAGFSGGIRLAACRTTT